MGHGDMQGLNSPSVAAARITPHCAYAGSVLDRARSRLAFPSGLVSTDRPADRPTDQPTDRAGQRAPMFVLPSNNLAALRGTPTDRQPPRPQFDALCARPPDRWLPPFRQRASALWFLVNPSYTCRILRRAQGASASDSAL